MCISSAQNGHLKQTQEAKFIEEKRPMVQFDTISDNERLYPKLSGIVRY